MPLAEIITPPEFKCPDGYTPLDPKILEMIEEGNSTFTKVIQIGYNPISEGYKNTEYELDLTNSYLLHQMHVSLTADYLKSYVA